MSDQIDAEPLTPYEVGQKRMQEFNAELMTAIRAGDTFDVATTKASGKGGSMYLEASVARLLNQPASFSELVGIVGASLDDAGRWYDQELSLETATQLQAEITAQKQQVLSAENQTLAQELTDARHEIQRLTAIRDGVGDAECLTLAKDSFFRAVDMTVATSGLPRSRAIAQTIQKQPTLYARYLSEMKAQAE